MVAYCSGAYAGQCCRIGGASGVETRSGSTDDRDGPASRDAAQLVGVPTWLWIDPGAWQTADASATAGPVTATATATPSKVVWDMGDGDTVTCDGPGTPYSASDPSATTDCSYTWTQPGSYEVTATVYWSVTWTAVGAPGGGNLGLQAGPPAEAEVQVTESQAINTPSGGSN